MGRADLPPELSSRRVGRGTPPGSKCVSIRDTPGRGRGLCLHPLGVGRPYSDTRPRSELGRPFGRDSAWPESAFLWPQRPRRSSRANRGAPGAAGPLGHRLGRGHARTPPAHARRHHLLTLSPRPRPASWPGHTPATRPRGGLGPQGQFPPRGEGQSWLCALGRPGALLHPTGSLGDPPPHQFAGHCLRALAGWGSIRPSLLPSGVEPRWCRLCSWPLLSVSTEKCHLGRPRLAVPPGQPQRGCSECVVWPGWAGSGRAASSGS